MSNRPRLKSALQKNSTLNPHNNRYLGVSGRCCSAINRQLSWVLSYWFRPIARRCLQNDGRR